MELGLEGETFKTGKKCETNLNPSRATVSRGILWV